MTAVLLDIGGVIIRTPFELLGPAERVHGLSSGQLGPRGPFGPPGSDPDFDAVVDGSMTERDYWATRARHAAPLLERAPTTEALIEALFDLPPNEIVRPETAAFIRQAQDAGCPLGLLTNDLEDFHGTGWFHALGVVPVDVLLVDGSRTGHLKPDLRAYQAAVDALDVAPGDVVYLDDQPINVRGGRRAGLHAIEFDPRAPATALVTARRALGLPVASPGR